MKAMFGFAGRRSMADLPITLKWENLDEAFDELEEDLRQVARGITLQAWSFVLRETPQSYGRMAASWSYSLGVPAYTDRSEMVTPNVPVDGPEPPLHRKGDAEAIAIANQYNSGPPQAFQLGDIVWFANGVEHGEGPYAGIVEDGYRLRPVNRPGQMVRRALDQISARYGEDVTHRQALALKKLKMGD